MASGSQSSIDPRDDVQRAVGRARLFDITAAASRAAQGEPSAGDQDCLRVARELLGALLTQDTIVATTRESRLAASGTVAALRSTVSLDDPNAREVVEQMMAAIDTTISTPEDQAARALMARVRDVFVAAARAGHEADVRRRAAENGPALWLRPTSLAS